MNKQNPIQIQISYFSKEVFLYVNDKLEVKSKSVESCLINFILKNFHEELKKLNSRKYYGLKFFSYNSIVPEYSDLYKEGLSIIIFNNTSIKDLKKILKAIGYNLIETGFENCNHFYNLVPRTVKEKVLINILK